MFSLIACQSHEAKDQSELTPPIFPDYAGITIPCNLSPINFGIQEALERELDNVMTKYILTQTKNISILAVFYILLLTLIGVKYSLMIVRRKDN